VKLVSGVIFTERNTVHLLDCLSFEYLSCAEPTKFLPTKFGHSDAKHLYQCLVLGLARKYVSSIMYVEHIKITYLGIAYKLIFVCSFQTHLRSS
jgi:hypothetical protein